MCSVLWVVAALLYGHQHAGAAIAQLGGERVASSAATLQHGCHHAASAERPCAPPDAATVAAEQRAAAHLNAPHNESIRTGGARRALQQASGPQPMRFHAVYQLDGVPRRFSSTLQNDVVPRAMAALSHKLRLRLPVGGALRLPRSCARSFVGSGECIETRPFCSTGAVPLVDELPDSFFGDYQLCSRPGNCRTLAGGAGTPGADFVVVVTSRASPACNAATDAHAVHCVLDEANWYGIPNRPLAGHINFCPRRKRLQGTRAVNSLVDTAVHELLHTLFMAESLFGKFVDQNGASAPLPRQGYLVTAPAVLRAARNHFNCPTVQGVPLEQNGGAAVEASHWEASIFGDEVMVGRPSSSERLVLSMMTMAMAWESGWYMPNWGAAGFLRYGHRAGCGMLRACRAPPGSPAQHYYCRNPQSTSRASACLMHEYTAWCASPALAPQCPALRAFWNGDCKDSSNVQRQFSGADVTPLGITYSPSSICIGVPGGRVQREGSRRIFFLQATCMATHCRPDGLHLSIKDVEGPGWSLYPCPEGQFVDLGAVAGYQAGTRVGPCPPADEVCPYKGCPTANGRLCAGQGNCFNGKCHCAVDATGPACGQRLGVA